MLIVRPLEIELVPQTAWHNNLRKILSKDKWSKLSKFVRSNCTCDICGRHLPMGQLDAHEKWSYDDEKHIQRLDDILSLCKDCHRVKHIGRAQAVGEGNLAENWYMKINKCSRHEFQEDLNNAANQWRERSMYRWMLDVSLIDDWEDKIK